MENQVKHTELPKLKAYPSTKLGDLSAEIQDIVILNESRYGKKFAAIIWNKDFPRQYGINLEEGRKNSEKIIEACNNYYSLKEENERYKSSYENQCKRIDGLVEEVDKLKEENELLKSSDKEVVIEGLLKQVELEKSENERLREAIVPDDNTLAVELLARFSGNSRGNPISKRAFIDAVLWIKSRVSALQSLETPKQ